MIPSELRLEYVLKNFFSIYQAQNPIENFIIDYSIDIGSLIYVPDRSNEFFNQRYLAIPNNIELKNSLPFLFETSVVEKVFIVEAGRVIFNVDIISNIFYFLSGWQETTSTHRDDLNRFTYKGSIQEKLNILHIPVVNYYFLILKEALEIAYKTQFENKISAPGSFVTCVTHDVDIWRNIWLSNLKKAIKRFDIIDCLSIIYKVTRNLHLQKEFYLIKDIQEKYGFRSTYFFLPAQGSYKGYKNADYNIKKRPFRLVLNKLSVAGNEIGIHGSFKSSESIDNFESDKKNLEIDALSSRFHYLMFSIETPSVLEETGIKIDSTLGFNSHPGFRNGSSYPFFLFDFKNIKITNVLEIPLIVMDVSLFDNKYLGISNAEKAFNHLKPILNEIKKTGGCLVLNWHNNSFTQSDSHNRTLLEEILKFANKENGVFRTCNQILSLLKVVNV